MKEVLLALYLASLQYSVSYELLYAVALTESSLNPAALNITSERNYDVGLMQINSFWVKKYGINPRDLYDPFYNAMWGAYILRYCQQRFGNSWKAVDCYHRGEARAKSWSLYTSRVYENLVKTFGGKETW